MGFFSSLFGGDQAKAARRAANQQARSAEEATAESRRQFDVTQGNIQPFIDAGAELIPQNAQNATLEGFGQNINDIFGSGVLDPLISERMNAVRTDSARSGLRRSGEGLQAIADVPTDLAFMLESLLTDRTSNVVGSGQNAAARLGALGADNARTIGGYLQDRGNARAQGTIGSANARAAGAQNILSLGSAGLGAAGSAGLLGGLGKFGAFLGAFSDPRLKQDVTKIGERNGMSVYTWKWIPEAPDFVQEQPGVGFMADEVLEKHPEWVDEFAGYMTVNYKEALCQ